MSILRPSRESATVSVRRTRMIAAPLVAAALVGGPVLLGGEASVGLPVASAHDAMVGSTPGQDDTVTEAPGSIDLEFSGVPREEFNTVALSRDDEVLATGEPTVDGNVLTFDIPEDVSLSDGTYTVGYQITSSDGHATRGSYDFTLATGGGPGAAATDTEDTGDANDADDADESEAQDDGLPSWAATAMAVAGVIVVLGALAVAFARFRNSASGDSHDDES